MAKRRHRRGRHGRRNPGIRAIFGAGRSAFSKENIKKAGGIIGGVIGTTALQRGLTSFGPLHMFRADAGSGALTKALDVFSMLFLSGVAGVITSKTPLRAYSGNVATGGVVAGVTRALQLFLGDHIRWGLSDYEGNQYWGTDGMGNFLNTGTPMVSLHGLNNWLSPRQVSAPIGTSGMGDFVSMPQMQHPMLTGMSHGGSGGGRISEDDVTASAIAGMGGLF